MFLCDQDGAPLPFRYQLSPMAKINCFDPRDLPAGSDKMDLRPTMLGVVFKSHFSSLPSKMTQLLWEALCVERFAFRLLVHEFRAALKSIGTHGIYWTEDYYWNPPLHVVTEDTNMCFCQSRIFHVVGAFLLNNGQVRVDPSPAVIKPLKPKLFLTGSLELPPLSATLLE